MNSAECGGVRLTAALLLFLLVLFLPAWAIPTPPAAVDEKAATVPAPLPAGVHAVPRPAGKWRIGVLFWHESPNDLAALRGIREGLSETGKDYDLIVERADSRKEEAIRILRRFREEAVDLLFAMGTEAALLAAAGVTDIPIVFTAVTNPVESGVVGSWKGSGRNIAGNSNWIGPDTVLHVFRLAVPRLERLGILRSRTTGVVSAAELRGMREYLARPGAPAVAIVEEVADGVTDIRAAVDRLIGSGVRAIWIPIDFLVYENMEKVLETVRPHGIPLVSSSLKGAKAGAVAGVLVDYAMLGKRAVVCALDILEKGCPPGSLPIGTMKGYEVVVNLTAARRCGYEIPLSLLALADLILEDADFVEDADLPPDGGDFQDSQRKEVREDG